VLYDFGPERGIDGMTLDVEGNIYAHGRQRPRRASTCSGPRDSGLSSPPPGSPSNCVFGIGDQASTLYITGARTATGRRRPGPYGLYHHVGARLSVFPRARDCAELNFAPPLMGTGLTQIHHSGAGWFSV
jgi:hypothetical protein